MNKLNIKLLKRIKRAILKRPDQFEMSWWFSDLHYVNRYRQGRGQPPLEKIGACGTAGCIAGWAVALHLRKPHDKINLSQAKQSSTTHGAYYVSSTAAKLLGIDDNQQASDNLFGLAWWPDEFKLRYRSAKTVQEQAQVAADRIDHYIRTNGAE